MRSRRQKKLNQKYFSDEFTANAEHRKILSQEGYIDPTQQHVVAEGTGAFLGLRNFRKSYPGFQDFHFIV